MVPVTAARTMPLETFARIPLFRGLNDTECRQLAEIAQLREYAAGDVILRQGQRSQELWILLEGKCDVVKLTSESKQEAVVLALLEPFSHFGEMSFFHSAPHSASVRAQTDVKLLRIIRGDYEELIQEGCRAAYKLAYNTLESMAERLRKMDDWVAELTSRQPAAQSNGTPPADEWTEFREKMLTHWQM